jgi:hypothetical protein
MQRQPDDSNLYYIIFHIYFLLAGALDLIVKDETRLKLYFK